MRGLGPVIAALGLLGLPATPPPDLAACAAGPTGAREKCLDSWARGAELDWRTWRALEDLLAQRREAVALSALDRLLLARRDPLAADARAAATAHDLRGRALGGLGRAREAATAFLEALRLDDGTVRVAWLSEAGRVADVGSVSGGSGLIERAGLATAEAGRTEEARALLERAISLGAGSEARLRWRALGGGSTADEPQPLLAPAWHPPFPVLTLASIDGRAIRLPPPEARAVVLAFWASWCVPCAEELPRLQLLMQAERERGLRVVAINIGEPVETVAMFAEALALELPIALADERSAEALRVESLPTTIVTDRHGRIRLRSDGYRRGSEEEIAALARELLEDAGGVQLEDVAEVLVGAELAEAEWARKVPAAIEGLALLPPGEDAAAGRIALAVGSELAVLAADGSVLSRSKVGPSVGRLRPVRSPSIAGPSVLTFRPGARRVVLVQPGEQEPQGWDAPFPVLDVEVGPRAHGILLGTISGLYRALPAGAPFVAVEGFGEVLDVVVADDAVAVLGPGGRLTWLDRDLRVTRSVETGFDAALALPAPGGDLLALTGAGVSAWASGRFLEAAAPQLALATADGQLLVLDAERRTRFRARWPGARGLAAGDLDQDGSDELLVAGGDRLVLLRFRPAENRAGLADRPS